MFVVSSACDVACESCTGAGPKKCRECHSGFTMDEAGECLGKGNILEESFLLK